MGKRVGGVGNAIAYAGRESGVGIHLGRGLRECASDRGLGVGGGGGEAWSTAGTHARRAKSWW